MFTHVDSKLQPTMVDVGNKPTSSRSATARCLLILPAEVLAHLDGGDIQSKKGPVFATAIIAGTMAAKKCWDLIPFCHPLPIDACKITIDFTSDEQLEIKACIKTNHKTGVEMEALTAVSIASLTIYDMCKAMSHDIVIRQTELVCKSGGKRDVHR